MEKFIDKPLEQYEEKFSIEVRKTAEDTFGKLVEETGTDREANKKTVTEYYKKVKEASRLKNIVKATRIFAILFLVVTVVLGIVSYLNQDTMLYTIIGGVIALALSILLFCIARKKLNSEHEVEAEVARLEEEAKVQTSPLAEAIDNFIPIEIFNSVFPNISLEKVFDYEKHEYFTTQFGLPRSLSDNQCVLGAWSGSISENPFLIYKRREQNMEDVAYEGQLKIYWQTVERDSDGNSRVVNHEQILTATTYHEAPTFREWVTACFGCEIAEDLEFSRGPFGVVQMSDGKLERKIKSKYKEYRKLAEKSISSGRPLTLLANEEFEALFGAIDRNDDTQFRLLFTPLAQQNMVKLIRDRKHDGDGFSFAKNGTYNVSISQNGQDVIFNYLGSELYYSFDLEIFEKQFIEFVCRYAEGVYMNIISFLNIPAYQQTEPEVKYADYTPIRSVNIPVVSNFEAEALVNDDPTYEADESKTLCITKARYTDSSEFYQIDSYGFDTEVMLEYVSVKGDDGEWHDVPVEWIKYNKVTSQNRYKF